MDKVCFTSPQASASAHDITTKTSTPVNMERFVNTQGGKGKNIPCDLHNEHVNRVFKEVVANMGSNFTQESSTRVARCVTSLDTLSELFDEQCAVPKESSKPRYEVR